MSCPSIALYVYLFIAHHLLGHAHALGLSLLDSLCIILLLALFNKSAIKLTKKKRN